MGPRILFHLMFSDGWALFQELPVSQGHSSRPVHLNQVLVEVLTFYNRPRLVPSSRFITSLILYEHSHTSLQRDQLGSVLRPSLMMCTVPLCHCLLSSRQLFFPQEIIGVVPP